jgi:hypothetical protein
MEADGLQAARAALHDWHDIWEGSQIEVTEVPSLIVEAVQYLKIHGDDLHGRPVVPVRGSLLHLSWPANRVLVEVAMSFAHLIQLMVEANYHSHLHLSDP